MITRDFLLRQVHQMAQALARVLFHAAEGQPQQARQEIDQALGAVPGSEVLRRGDLERGDVLALCHTEDGLSAELALALADLLKEKALLGDDESARHHFRYALWLYEGALGVEGAVVPADIHERIAWLSQEAVGPRG